MAKKSDTVFTNFVPSSDKLKALAANHAKAVKATTDATEAMRLAVFDGLLKAKVVTEAEKERFAVSSRWGQWAWFLRSEASEAKGKGMEL